jgi:hypothetical protein
MLGMHATAPTAVPATPARARARRCEGVEVFKAGRYRGKRYSLRDLDDIIRNFDELGPAGLDLLQPPAVLGHEERQEFLERTDLPAAGWVKRLWRDGPTLMADIGGVPNDIADAIDRRLYRKVSAEIYDDFLDDDGVGHGKALRRIGILGGEIPQVKSLADIPFTTPDYGDEPTSTPVRRTRRGAARSLKAAGMSELRGGVTVCFCEVRPFESFASAEWEPYTNPETKQRGIKSKGGRVIYGPRADRILARQQSGATAGRAKGVAKARVKRKVGEAAQKAQTVGSQARDVQHQIGKAGNALGLVRGTTQQDMLRDMVQAAKELQQAKAALKASPGPTKREHVKNLNRRVARL